MLPTLFKGVLIMGAAAMLVIGMASCSKKAPEQKAATETPLPPNSNLALVKALGDSVEKIVLTGPDAAGPQLVVVPSLAGRVMGASFDGDMGENLMWVDKSILDRSFWTAKPAKWNAGGLRTWLAPEDLFFLPEDKDPKKWFVPAELDPAPFNVVAKGQDEVTLQTEVHLKANIGKTYDLLLTRRIKVLPFFSHPKIAELPKDVKYMGIFLFHSIENIGDAVIGKDLPYICLWSLLQVNPSGTMLIPLAKGADPKKAYREYFNPLGPDRIAVENGIISVKIDGAYRSKIGVHARAAGAGIAFLRDSGGGQGVLLVKLFDVDPKGIYVDKPWGKSSGYGDVIEMYNDDGAMGGFTELECHSPAKKMEKNGAEAHEINLHIFKGPIPELKTIGSALLGVDLTRAKYF